VVLHIPHPSLSLPLEVMAQLCVIQMDKVLYPKYRPKTHTHDDDAGVSDDNAIAPAKKPSISSLSLSSMLNVQHGKKQLSSFHELGLFEIVFVETKWKPVKSPEEPLKLKEHGVSLNG